MAIAVVLLAGCGSGHRASARPQHQDVQSTTTSTTAVPSAGPFIGIAAAAAPLAPARNGS